MGFFDIQVKKELKSQKEAIVLEESLKTVLKENEHFKADGGLLKYNITYTQDKNDLFIDGELQNTLIIAIFIILSILITYGLGVIIVVGFVYYQKVVANKQLKALIDKTKGTDIA